MMVVSNGSSTSAAPLAVMSIPENYGIVEPGIYRASALKVHSLAFVSNLHLKTLLHLSPEPLCPVIGTFLQQSAVNLIHLGAREGKPASWKPVSENMMKDALEIVLDDSMYPIMVTCSSGIQQTGTFVGCLRRLQKWNLTSIIEEYRRYAGNKAHYANEQFLELFDEDIVKLPSNLAPWFADQQRIMEEEKAEFQKQIEEKQQQDSNSSLSSWQAMSAGKDFKTSCSSYARYYYCSSCPLTTEDRYRKRRNMGRTG
ncbi:probable tyrosine-protein phosphatase DG1060 [Selaginella moellendorffii]|nr:probable tyrosine-protein phosphatase DG1060 [Selaginella moellendorffii]|eukprot:XP_002988621.2 probable tyrosine-protein phosphatase DG1060 [Selaginella moellendorffii]